MYVVSRIHHRVEGTHEVESTEHQEKEESVDIEDGKGCGLTLSHFIFLPCNALVLLCLSHLLASGEFSKDLLRHGTHTLDSYSGDRK